MNPGRGERPGQADVSGAATSIAVESTRPRGGTRRTRSVLAELGLWLAASIEQRQVWAHCVRVAADTAKHYRSVVLAHPDLAGKVAELYDLAKPEQWGGYLPPAVDDWGRSSRSPYRAALLDIIGEAKRREAGGHDG